MMEPRWWSLVFLVAAVVAQRELVRTAHPHLKARFAATGKLTSEDFAAAAAMPLGKTPARARPRAGGRFFRSRNTARQCEVIAV